MWTDSGLDEHHDLSLFGTSEEVDQLFEDAIAILERPATGSSHLQDETVWMAVLASRVQKAMREQAAAEEAEEAKKAFFDVDEVDEDAGFSLEALSDALDEEVNEGLGRSVNQIHAAAETMSDFVGKSVNHDSVGHLRIDEALLPEPEGVAVGKTGNEAPFSSDRSFSPDCLTSTGEDEEGEVPSLISSDRASSRFKHSDDEGRSQGLSKHEGPPRWRDLGLISGVRARNDALAGRHRERSAVTINLGRNVATLLKTKSNPAGWFAKRIGLYLKPLEKALGRELGFWIVLETWTKTGPRSHFHGVIACSSEERPAVEEVLRRAAGEWDSRRGEEHQIDWSEWDGPPDDGWINYVLKNADRTHRAHPGIRIFAADKQTHDDAKLVFETWRERQIGAPVAGGENIND